MVSEQNIFRATSGLAINASLARTLAYCIFWSQHASHWDGELPTIWKTGPELHSALRIAPRTANRHFKDIAKMKYWTISYRPRPGSIGKVTWLTMTERALRLLETARELAAARPKRKKHIATFDGANDHQPDDHKHDIPSHQNVTLKKTQEPEVTTAEKQSFILSGESGKKGMNEGWLKNTPEEKLKAKPGCPKYVGASDSDKALAGIISSVWSGAGLQEWDWSSKFTWKYVTEIRQKLGAFGLSEDKAVEAFLEAMLGKWSWLRSCLASRYSSHPTNLHAPSPMAFAVEFGVIAKAVLGQPNVVKTESAKSGLDDDL